MSNKLDLGERLNVGQQLTSSNGRFVLLMQTDSNLVLYHDGVAEGHAYWTTNTEWLPPDQKPTYVLMQTDANLVMYDNGGHARWASGTWGPAFIAPHIILEDDGNLVIYHNGSQPIWASGRVGGDGAIPPVGFVPSAPTVESIVDQGGKDAAGYFW